MDNISLKLLDWLNKKSINNFKFNNIKLENWLSVNHSILSTQMEKNKKTIFIVCEDQYRSNELFNSFPLLKNRILLAGPESGPYEEHVHSESKINSFINSLTTIYTQRELIVFTDYQTLSLRFPEPQEILDHEILIKVQDSFPPEKLGLALEAAGFRESEISKEPLTYAKRGEIFDICLDEDKIYRLNYFDEYVEHIFKIDPETYKADRSTEIDKISITPNFKTFLGKENIQNLRLAIPKPSPRFKNKNEIRNRVFENVSKNIIPENAFHFFPLLFKSQTNFQAYVKDSFFVCENFENALRSLSLFKDNLSEAFELQVDDPQSRNLFFAPKKIYHFDFIENDLKKIEINSFNIGITQSFEDTIETEQTNLYQLLGLQKSITPKSELLQNLVNLLKSNKKPKFINFCGSPEDKNFKNLINTFEIPLSTFKFLNINISESFYSALNDSLFLSAVDLFGSTKKKKKKKKTQNFFAEQIATLRLGDFLVHKKHGIGSFCGVQAIESNGRSNDFIVIQYKDKDKVYVPMYNLDLIQKYADSNSDCRLADLKSKKFEKTKTQVRKAVKELAFSVIKLQAEREAFKGYAYSEPGDDYQNFASAFPYTLTDDQHSSIEAIMDDMCSTKPMDRLICGDVGFGKTEVAMRAAFKAVEDGKQVAILVPTTILSLQHYMNFQERFKDFPVEIDYVSRFISTKKTNEIYLKVKEGKSDILIGTHKILSSKLEFSDLGLVIIDEEHRFGVAQKEKLKLFKKDTDFLTLTATPIPRTLQLSFLGIKDLSLIQTAPPRRQSISSYMVRENDKTIQNAIQNELARKGQVFIIHNRVKDIEVVVGKIRSLAPGAKITFAHGQMSEKDLESRIQSFYSGKYDILIATTIVESGIDIPTANTMIINNSHAFGLAQLHQLRGRIGRSNKKAFCYFLIPDNKELNATAAKRLEALQRYSSIGGGFALANSDLEIRGAGNVLGGEQSGHIQNIGLELYSEMLKEAIAEIKGETKELMSSDVDIKAFFQSLIPSHYITDQNNRLKYYKIISNSDSNSELDQLIEELVDIFGPAPSEIHNLFNLIKMRNISKMYPLTGVSISERQITIKVDQDYLAQHTQVRDKLVSVTLNKTDLYKLKPNYSVICHYRQKDSSTSIDNLSKVLGMIFPSLT